MTASPLHGLIDARDKLELLLNVEEEGDIEEGHSNTVIVYLIKVL